MSEHVGFAVLDVTILTKMKSIFLLQSWAGHFTIHTGRFALLYPVPL